MCSVCKGTGAAPQPGHSCICLGLGTHAAELEGLRAGWEGMRDILGSIMGYLATIGYKVQHPSHIIGALEQMKGQIDELQESYVKLKKG